MAINPALTYEQWSALGDVEAKMYAGEYGAHAYTSVNDGPADPLLAAMWANAEMQAEGTGDYDALELVEEAARRVAAALAILAFGAEFGAELAAKAQA